METVKEEGQEGRGKVMDESLTTCFPNRQYRTRHRELRSMINIRRAMLGRGKSGV